MAQLNNQQPTQHSKGAQGLPALPSNIPFISNLMTLIRGAAGDEKMRQSCIKYFEYHAAKADYKVTEYQRRAEQTEANLARVTRSREDAKTSFHIKRIEAEMISLDKDRKSLTKCFDRQMFAREYNRGYVRLFEELEPISVPSVSKMSGLVSFASALTFRAAREDMKMRVAMEQLSDLGLSENEAPAIEMNSVINQLRAEFATPETRANLSSEKLDAIEKRLYSERVR